MNGFIMELLNLEDIIFWNFFVEGSKMNIGYSINSVYIYSIIGFRVRNKWRLNLI